MRPRAWLAVVALILLGAVGGVAFDRFHLLPSHGGMSRLHERLRRDPIGVMDRELHMTPEQRTHVAAILERRQKDIDAVWEDTHTRLKATIDSVVNEIAAELDSAQAVRFREVANKLHSTPGFMPQPSH